MEVMVGTWGLEPNHLGNSTANKPEAPADPNPFIYRALSSAFRAFFGSDAKRRFLRYQHAADILASLRPPKKQLSQYFSQQVNGC
jgi:hypothetical protein